MSDFSRKITVAREAILQELRRRWRDETRGFGVTAPADISRFRHPQTNYFCGRGKMTCPLCNGVLHYERSPLNGHVMARCETPECVRWME